MLLFATATFASCQALIDEIGGDFEHAPAAMASGLSEESRDLLASATCDLPAGRYVDLHVHALGPEVHPNWRSWLHPAMRVRSSVYLSAARVRDVERVGEESAERLVELVDHFPARGKFFVYAMDRTYGEDGRPDAERTAFFVSNEAVVELASRRPDALVPVISVHPRRPDALEELRLWRAAGCRFVKWIPSAMAFDPADARLDFFYAELRELDLTLLVHTGAEGAMETWDTAKFDNPQRLRRALDAGVRVVALHCGTGASFADLDDPRGGEREGFELFLEMLEDPRHEGRLFGDTSALVFLTRGAQYLEQLLARPELHSRLVHGSDYPLCAIDVLVWLSRFESAGLLDPRDSGALREIYVYNPLAFELALMRSLSHPRTGRRFAASVFALPAGWDAH